MKFRLLLALVAIPAFSVAQDSGKTAEKAPEADAEKKPDAAAPAEDAAALPRADAADEKAVRALIGKKAVISGDVTNTFASDKGMTFLNIAGGKFTVVCWKDSYSKFEGGSPAKLYKGKRIEVTGKVEEYEGRGGKNAFTLQIKLRDPSQVKVTGDAASGAQPAGKEEKKEDGKESGEKKIPGKPAEKKAGES